MALPAHQAHVGMYQRPHAVPLVLRVRGCAAQQRAAAMPSRGTQRRVAAAAGAGDGTQSSSTGAPQPAVVVTGASSGIGKSTAAALAARGWRVFAGVRSIEAAAELRALDSSIEPLTIDVTRCVVRCQAARATHNLQNRCALIHPADTVILKTHAQRVARQPRPCSRRHLPASTHHGHPYPPPAAPRACARRQQVCSRQSALEGCRGSSTTQGLGSSYLSNTSQVR